MTQEGRLIREKTPYRYSAQCPECGRDYTSTVEYIECRAMYGDFISTVDYVVPAYCPTCREEPGNSNLRRVNVRFGAELRPIGWIKKLFDRLEHPKDPVLPQSEQVEIFLDMIPELQDPTGAFDVEGFQDRDGAPFYYAHCRLDYEPFVDLCEKARKQYQVQVKGLAYRGERYMRESGLIEQIEVDSEPCPESYDVVPHIDFLDQTGTYIAVAHHPETEANEVIFDGEPIPHVDYGSGSDEASLSNVRLTWGSGSGSAGAANTARSILQHATALAEDPPDVPLSRPNVSTGFRGFDGYTSPPTGESGEMITYDGAIEYLRQKAAEEEN